MLGSVAVFAALITASTLGAFAWGLSMSGDTGYATALTFLTLGIAQTLHLVNARSAGAVTTRSAILRNPYALGAAVLTLGLLLLTVYLEPLSQLLGTQPPTARDWLVVVTLAALPAILGQSWKLLRPRTLAPRISGH
jgi:Ca2+-transporting ATPase